MLLPTQHTRVQEQDAGKPPAVVAQLLGDRFGTRRVEVEFRHLLSTRGARGR